MAVTNYNFNNTFSFIIFFFINLLCFETMIVKGRDIVGWNQNKWFYNVIIIEEMYSLKEASKNNKKEKQKWHKRVIWWLIREDKVF